MLEVTGLTCVRNDRLLFNELNFSVQQGELVQIEGENGAGKTTLLRIIAGLAMIDKGDVLWQGKSISCQRDEYNQNLLYLGHQVGVKSVLTPYENLVFYQKVNKQPLDGIEAALSKVGLMGYEDVTVAQLSAGQQRRVALARLWLSQAPLWILDEPLTAIDKQGVEQLIGLFEQHVLNGGMILLTSHQDILGTENHIKKVQLAGGEWL